MLWRSSKYFARRVVRLLARLLGQGFPLSIRQHLVLSVSRFSPTSLGHEFAMGMLEDVRRSDPTALHRFLWSNHVAYANTYDVRRRYGANNINETRHMLFHDMGDHLRSRGMDPSTGVRSVLEIGCSAGYLLRHLETEIFPSAGVLHGIDIDANAVGAGAAHLNSLGSKVELFAADLQTADRIIGNRIYDVALCCGVLMYVSEEIAEQLIRTLLRHAGNLIGLICLSPRADPQRSGARVSDGAFIHNIGNMIHRAGGHIISSRFAGPEISGGNPSDIILAQGATD